MKKALIIGGGFAGCAATHHLMMMGGWDVTLIESAPFLGAGNRTQWYGGHPYTFGPRHFLTRNEAVYRYLDSLLPIRRCQDHEFITYVERDNAFYNFPIHRDDIAAMPDRENVERELTELRGVENVRNFEEYWIGSVGPTLYEKFINAYSKKMWQIDDNRKIDTFSWSPKGVAIKEGPRAAWDVAISGYPYAPDGYNGYFDISTQGATVLLNTRIEQYDIPNKTVWINGEKKKYDIIVSTVSPDDLFGHCYGNLPYIGRDLHKIVLPSEFVFPEHVYFIYYANDEQFTRLVEYKRFTHHKAPNTLIGMEIPSGNGRHYPIPIRTNFELAERYYAEMPEGVFSTGRAGTYRYGVDIDDCIEHAMLIVDILKQGGQEHAVPGRTKTSALDL